MCVYIMWTNTTNTLAFATVLAALVLWNAGDTEGMRERKPRKRPRKRSSRRSSLKRSSLKHGNGKDGWKTGSMTYYWADEPDIGNGTGAKGIRDNKLVPMKSIALKGSLGEKYFGRRVEIEGMGSDFRVDDQCLGGECKEIDLYVGKTQGGHDGVKRIRYRIL